MNPYNLKKDGGKISPKHSVNSANWKGDNVGYSALHAWVKKWLPRVTDRSGDKCEKCGAAQERQPYDERLGRVGRTNIEICNLSGEYRRNFDDWAWLCKSCHVKLDTSPEKMNKIVPGHRYYEELSKKALTYK